MPVSHQLYDRLAVRFTTGIRPCGRSQTKLNTSNWFSLNVRQPYDARTIVLRSWTGLSSDVLAMLQVRPCDNRANFMSCRTVRDVQQPCNIIIKRKFIAQLLRGSLAAFAGEMHACELLV